jgi:FMN-dependent NADH-azoreductase
MAPHTPALAALLPLHQASLAAAHHRARELAARIARGTTAA